MQKLLRWSDLLATLPVGKSTLQRWIAQEDDPFPAPKYIRRTAFFEQDEVNDWIKRNMRNEHESMVNFKRTKSLGK